MPDDSIPKKRFDAKVANIRRVAGDIFEISIEFDAPFAFSAGQYVWIEIPNLIYPDPRGARRAFSIISAPDGKTIKTIFKTSDSGFKKSLVSLKQGNPVIVHGPFGSFLRKGLESENDLIFIGGGMAMAPYLSVVRDLPKHTKNRQIFLIHVNKENEAAYTDELKQIDDGSKNFSYLEYFDRLKEEQIKDFAAKFPEAYWYVTGPQGFVDSVWELIKNNHIDPERVGFEEHYPLEHVNLTTEDLMRDSSSVFRLALDKAFLHIVITDVNGVVLYANEMAQKTTGFSEKEMIGQTPRLWGGLMSPDFYKDLWLTKKSYQTPFTGKITNRRKNGEVYISLTTISPIINSEGTTIGFIGTEEDVTKSEEATRDLERFNRLMVNRELKMAELKKEIETLRKKT